MACTGGESEEEEAMDTFIDMHIARTTATLRSRSHTLNAVNRTI